MKTIKWLGSSKKDFLKFPKKVIQEIGYALHVAQKAKRYKKAKLFKGCGPRVYEIALDNDKNAYRCVYIVDFIDTLYVVHCFQKKSKRKIKTPKEEVDVIKQRLTLLRQSISEGK